mmetsp:Transcript_23419/g.92823  ORF Transcript_23419/g.92823 Transcript_23419/m.92823 type:complete len:222 (-) Transcript_23419:263-928(-)
MKASSLTALGAAGADASVSASGSARGTFLRAAWKLQLLSAVVCPGTAAAVSRNSKLRAWLQTLPARKTRRPSGVRRSASSFGSSEYSTTPHLPSTRARTPTFSDGSRFVTVLEAAAALRSEAYPKKTGSHGLLNALSTESTWTYATFCWRHSARMPESLSARYTPPLPSGATATSVPEAMTTRGNAASYASPETKSSAGSVAWSKNLTRSGSSAKYSASRK